MHYNINQGEIIGLPSCLFKAHRHLLGGWPLYIKWCSSGVFGRFPTKPLHDLEWTKETHDLLCQNFKFNTHQAAVGERKRVEGFEKKTKKSRVWIFRLHDHRVLNISDIVNDLGRFWKENRGRAISSSLRALFLGTCGNFYSILKLGSKFSCTVFLLRNTILSPSRPPSFVMM